MTHVAEREVMAGRTQPKHFGPRERIATGDDERRSQ